MKRVVIAEDEPITCMDLSDMLTELQFTVVGTASDGFDAIELCRQHRPDVVLMDVRMPVFDGLTAAEMILAEQTAQCVVLLTAFSDADIVERARRIGITAYLVKPINLQSLRPAIEIAIEQSQRLKQSREETEKLRTKLEEDRKIRKAQAILARTRGCTESEAYQWLRKSAMDKRVSMSTLVDAVLEQEQRKDPVFLAKRMLMEQRGLSEEKAYHRIAALSKSKGISMEIAACELYDQLKGRK